MAQQQHRRSRGVPAPNPTVHGADTIPRRCGSRRRNSPVIVRGGFRVRRNAVYSLYVANLRGRRMVARRSTMQRLFMMNRIAVFTINYRRLQQECDDMVDWPEYGPAFPEFKVLFGTMRRLALRFRRWLLQIHAMSGGNKDDGIPHGADVHRQSATISQKLFSLLLLLSAVMVVAGSTALFVLRF